MEREPSSSQPKGQKKKGPGFLERHKREAGVVAFGGLLASVAILERTFGKTDTQWIGDKIKHAEQAEKKGDWEAYVQDMDAAAERLRQLVHGKKGNIPLTAEQASQWLCDAAVYTSRAEGAHKDHASLGSGHNFTEDAALKLQRKKMFDRAGKDGEEAFYLNPTEESTYRILNYLLRKEGGWDQDYYKWIDVRRIDADEATIKKAWAITEAFFQKRKKKPTTEHERECTDAIHEMRQKCLQALAGKEFTAEEKDKLVNTIQKEIFLAKKKFEDAQKSKRGQAQRMRPKF